MPPSAPDLTPVVVTIRGELDASDTRWATELDAAVATGARRVVVDMLGVTFVDSSVVRALADTCRALQSAGGWLRVVYTHHLVRRVIAIYGAASTLPQYASVSTALRGSPTSVRHDDAGYTPVKAENNPRR